MSYTDWPVEFEYEEYSLPSMPKCITKSDIACLNESPIIDQTIIESLIAVISPSRLAQLLETFHTTAIDIITDMAQAVEHGDTSTIEICAHTVKGTALSIGLNRLAECALLIQNYYHNNDEKKALLAVEELAKIYIESAHHITLLTQDLYNRHLKTA